MHTLTVSRARAPRRRQRHRDEARPHRHDAQSPLYTRSLSAITRCGTTTTRMHFATTRGRIGQFNTRTPHFSLAPLISHARRAFLIHHHAFLTHPAHFSSETNNADIAPAPRATAPADRQVDHRLTRSLLAPLSTVGHHDGHARCPRDLHAVHHSRSSSLTQHITQEFDHENPSRQRPCGAAARQTFH